jgi:methionyl-tRNA formyltransferase
LTSLHQKVLFFGKFNCDYSQRAIEHLEKLGFSVQAVLSRFRNEELPTEVKHWRGEYIISFKSYFVLPASLIEMSRIAAINFHPAPPKYRGSGGATWALYFEEEIFGVTAHLIDEQIDNGTIIECRRFPIYQGDNVSSLLKRSEIHTFDLFSDLTTGLAREGYTFLEKKINSSIIEKWNGPARKINEVDKLQEVDLSIRRDELEKIIRAVHSSKFPLRIRLHGYTFYLNH